MLTAWEVRELVEGVSMAEITSDPRLMIRVVALSGRVPVEAFLRAARELATTAAEVGRTASTAEDGALPLPNTGLLPPEEVPPQEMPPGWHIVDADYSGPAESLATGAMDGLSGRHSVSLVIAPPPAQRAAAQQVREGIRAIQARCEERPAGFSDAALRSLRRVAMLSARQLRVSVSAGRGEGEAVELGDAVVA